MAAPIAKLIRSENTNFEIKICFN